MKPVSFVNIKGVTAALETNPRVHASISALIKKQIHEIKAREVSAA